MAGKLDVFFVSIYVNIMCSNFHIIVEASSSVLIFISVIAYF